MGQPYSLLMEHGEEESAEELFRTVLREAEHDRPWKGEIRNRSRSGFEFWTELSLIPVRVSDSTLENFIHIGFDVSERKSVERYLASSQIFAKSLVESATVGLFVASSTGACIYVNPRWSERTGLVLEQAKCSGWLRAVHPDDLGFVERHASQE
ncbi:MAG: PAS domain S-box protein [Methylotenera sp.]|nr:PAS domain S-box protein [Oligoflexia bacterium]